MPQYRKLHCQNSGAEFMSEHLKTQQEANQEQLIHFLARLWYIIDSIRSPHKKKMPPYRKVHRRNSAATSMSEHLKTQQEAIQEQLIHF